jgi:hypothetical protein
MLGMVFWIGFDRLQFLNKHPSILFGWALFAPSVDDLLGRDFPAA